MKIRSKISNYGANNSSIGVVHLNPPNPIIHYTFCLKYLTAIGTYRQILQQHPGQKAIIASGYSGTDRVKATLRLGAGSYIRKPYLLETIGKAVKTVLAR